MFSERPPLLAHQQRTELSTISTLTMSSSVTYSQGSSNAEWEGMRPTITHIWLNQAYHLRDLIHILRHQYGIVSTEKICRVRLQRWGLNTYKRPGALVSQDGSREPPRKRKSRQTGGSANQGQSQPPLPLLDSAVPAPSTGIFVRPDAYRRLELVLHSIDQFANALFGDSRERFTYVELIRPKVQEDHSLSWQRIADLYEAAEGYFRGGCMRKFLNSTRKARLELQLLVDLPALQPTEIQRMHQHVMITRLWRICHKLLRLDLAWLQYEYSFLLDFLIEFERLVYKTYGEIHPLRSLLSVLSRMSKEDVHGVVRLGAERTMWVLAPGMDERKGKLVFLYWTGFMYQA
ncbi:hypothetical protein ACJZ2D_011146 [Fusarium nematophilum]